MAHCKPVIVDKGYLMEKILNKYNWKIATSGDYRSIADAIEHLIDTNYQVESSSYRKFIEDHSIEKFQSVIIQTCNLFYI
jgi:glycosyltransferase involved in cell wall biosynthesis